MARSNNTTTALGSGVFTGRLEVDMYRIALFCACVCIFPIMGVMEARAQSSDIVNQETLTKAYSAFEGKRYKECIRLCDNILIRNPSHVEAKKLKQKARSEIKRLKEKVRSAISSRNFKKAYPILTRRPSRYRLRFEYRYASKRFLEARGDYRAESGLPKEFNTPGNEIRASLNYRFPYNYFFWGFGGGGLISVLSNKGVSPLMKDTSLVGYGFFARLYLGLTVLPFSKSFGLALEFDIQPSVTFGDFSPELKSSSVPEEWRYDRAIDLDFTLNLLLQIKGWYLIVGVGGSIYGSFVVSVGLEAW